MTPLRQLFRTRLALRSAAITLVAVGVLGVVSLTMAVFVNEKRAREQEYERLEELLDTIQQTVQIACFLSNQELATEVASGLLNNDIVRRVTIFQNGTALVDRPQQESAADRKISPLERSVRSPFNPQEEVCRITLVPDAAEIRRSVVEASVFISILLSLQLLGIGIVVILVMIGFVTRPISRVSQRLDKLEAETGQKLQIPKGNEEDEIGRLVVSVNTMIDHLVNVLGVERRLRVEREVEEKRFRTIFENVETGIFELDSHGQLVGANPAFLRMFGLSPAFDPAEEIRLLRNIVDESTELESLLDALPGKDSPAGQAELPITVEGRSRWISVILTPIEEGRMQGVANDITERRLAADAAKHMAVTDPLTGLGNRRGLEWRLSAAVRVHENDPDYRSVLILLDLDHFKEANDTLGHAVGDKVLQHVGSLLTELVRKSDYVARLGGDEFVVLLDGATDREDVEAIVVRFLERVNKPIPVDEHSTVHVGASLGVAVLGQDADSEQELVRLADAAMYDAKHAGRNTYRFHGDSSGGNG